MNRDIFDELMDGHGALANDRQGQVTLRTHKVKQPKLASITAEPLALVELNHAKSQEQLHSQRIGTMKAKLALPEDLDAPLPDDLLDDFERPQE